MKGIIYTRVSSEEQITGTSLDFQEKQCREYCKQKGIQVMEVFREEGASAKTAVRAEFLRAIEYCRKNKGQVKFFIVAKVDRFARNTEDHFAVRKMLLDYGVQLHSVTEPIGGNSPMEKLFETLLAGFADFDNAIRRQRCMDGMSERVNRGIYPWKPPIGYVPANTRKQGLKKTEPDPPDELLFPIIQRALIEFSKGKTSKMELTRLLDVWGMADKRGGKKSYIQMVDKMLAPRRLKFYAGIIENPWTKMDVKGLHVAMIDTMTYQRILYILSGKKPQKPRLAFNDNYPLRGIVLCETCSNSLTGSTSRGNGGQYHYYHCKNKHCTQYGKTIKKDDLEKLYSEYLKKIKPTAAFLRAFKASVIDYWQEQGESLSQTANSFQKQLTALEARRKRICDMRESGEYSPEEFAERKGFIDSQITTMKIATSEARIEQFDVEVAVSYATQFIEDLHQQWVDLPASVRPRFQKLVFPEKITPKQLGGVGTVKLGCVFELNQQCVAESSTVVTH